ncbi:MAG: hypothetical protein K8R85_07050, partial [Bacteroidetes bacterium]|nr:hypothetical protein [Bacteroidota bacterium]
IFAEFILQRRMYPELLSKESLTQYWQLSTKNYQLSTNLTMIATIEISMYPLSDQYKQKIIDFVLRLKGNKNIRVEVIGLSTQLVGEYDLLMEVLTKEMRTDFENGKAMFILKIAGTEMTKETLPDEFK